jgi:hypothetical protein
MKALKWFPLKKLVTAILVTVGLALLYTGVVLAAAADLDQCANGSIAAPEPCDGNGSGNDGWTNGNVGASKAHWKEGDFLPYRMKLTGITSGTWTLVITWDIMKGGKHAIDYLGSFDETETLAMGNNPCDTIGCDLTNFDAFPIPLDPTGPEDCGLAGATQTPGDFYIFGATGTTVEIVSVSAYSLTSCQPESGDITNSIAIRFTSTDPNPVIAWSGHVATQFDWGQGKSASGITGSPYHTSLEGLCAGSLGTECDDGGSQDRSLAASAIAFVTMTTQRDPSGTIAVGGNVRDVATLTGNNAGTSPPSGVVDFYVCRSVNPTITPECNDPSDAWPVPGTPFANDVAVVTSTNTGTATSPFFTNTNQVGKYCFLAMYDSSTAVYGDSIADILPTDPIAEINAECFTISGATAVTLTDFTARTGDGRGLMIAVLGIVGLGILGAVGFAFTRRR